MMSLAGLLADGVLANAILIPPRLPPTNMRKGRFVEKSTETSNKKTVYS